jgi:hypothetical protein
LLCVLTVAIELHFDAEWQIGKGFRKVDVAGERIQPVALTVDEVTMGGCRAPSPHEAGRSSPPHRGG